MTARASEASPGSGWTRLPAVALVVGWLILGLGPTRRVAAIHQGYGIRATAVAVIAVVGCLALWSRRGPLGGRWAAVAVTVAVAVSGAAAGGRIVGVWLAMTTLLAAWAVFERPIPRLPAFPPRLLPVVVVLSLASAYLAGAVYRLNAALVFLGLSGLVAVIVAHRPSMIDRCRDAVVGAPTVIGRNIPRAARAVRRHAGRLARVIQRAARRVLLPLVLVPLWAAVALGPWLFQRLVRFDPMATPRRSGEGGTWIARVDDHDQTDRLWFLDPARERPSLGRRLHRKMAPVAAALLLIVSALGGLSLFKVREERNNVVDSTEARTLLESTPWWEELRGAGRDVVSKISFSQYVGNEWPDYESPYLNIEGGRRRTWRSETCAAGQPIVWFFGGSTTYGIDQRDDFTLPSAFAKEADRRGFPVIVENWGMVGDVSWQQNRRLERALASGVTPDIVVYYDGFNDLRAVGDMDFTGRNEVDNDFVGPMDVKLERILTEHRGFPSWFSKSLWFEFTPVRVPEPMPDLEPDEIVDLVSNSLAAADHLARLITQDAGIEFLHIYQPSLDTRSPTITGEPMPDPDFAAMTTEIRSRLPEEIDDMGSILNDIDRPFFYDDVHTLEAANPLIADEIVDSLEPTLEALSKARIDAGGDPCQ